jgi:transcriptional regulator with XRE-family HTH domain
MDGQELKPLLRRFRTRIDPGSTMLGPNERIPFRCGKRVTQEELAECIGISSTWYARLESDRPVRASVVLLDRLAIALMLSQKERAALFNLALPELRLMRVVSNELLEEAC